ncbi:MAG: hypothetical protein JNM56_11660 [Planctomycetia bacterium]|nr:hypothetical protein [Planctomycetia bacterium]
MPTLGPQYLAAVISAAESPSVSIYQPTHRHHPDNVQDPIRFKNLVKQVEESLSRDYPSREVRPLLEPLQRLQGDTIFWNHTLDGLAVLASPARCDVFKLPRAVPELAVVAGSFHVKPLLRYVQSADRFQVLAVAQDKFALFEGNRYALDSIPVPPVAGPVRVPAPSDPRAETVYGEGIAGYFRAVDRAVTEEVSKPAGVPLLLAALSENLTPFRAVAKNPFLIPDAIAGTDPFALDAEGLRARAWAVLEPHYLARLETLSRDFNTAFSRQQGTGDLSDAARAAVAGRIGTVLIDADAVQPGTINPATGAIVPKDLADPKVDDKLDDLAELVLKTGGTVVIVPTERMPTKSGLAAIFRY